MQENRRLGRWQIDTRAEINLEGEEGPEPCTVHDINFKGARISLAKKINPDTFVKVNILFSSGLSLSAQVWVVWHKTIDGHNMHGIYFTQLKDKDKEKLYQFVRKHFPQAVVKQWWNGMDKTKGGEEMKNGRIEDKRIFERLPAKLPVRFMGISANIDSNAFTQDISAKGIGLLCNLELTPRTPLEMWIKIPDKGEPLYTRGEVVWSRPQGANQYRAGINLERADLMGLSRVLRAG